MGACGRRVKKIVKGIARELTPVGVGLIGQIVEIVATTEWTNEEKRERAVEMSKGALESALIDAKESAIRGTVELCVSTLKDGEEALRELGQADADDEAEIEALG